jgi:hypothetical protein
MSIVTTHYRYKRPPRRKKAVALAVPEIVAIPRKKGGKVTAPPAETDAESKPEVKSAIVTARKRGRRFADVPDVTPEEHRREGDLADELWREMVRRVTGKDHLMRKIPSTTRVRRPAPVPNARAV